jgi:hypothetical protein
MVTYTVKHNLENVGVINAIPDGFALKDGEDLWPQFLEKNKSAIRQLQPLLVRFLV